MYPLTIRVFFYVALAFSVLSSTPSLAVAEDGVYVDKQGVMRWQDSQKEVALFGVNYNTPFSYSYMAQKQMGVDLKAAIDADVSHFHRMGLDAFRIHLWDRQISDGAGNLLENEHLELFDYLVKKLTEHDIKIIITTIGWWGANWPAPPADDIGFSNNYDRVELSSNPETYPIQRRFIKQIMTHVNSYTGKSYINDPQIIAMELFNEPKHGGKHEGVTEYVNSLVKVLRDEGFEKPIYYNVSEQGNNVKFAKAVCSSNIQGITYQWYPSGLMHMSKIEGNMLPNVDKYTNPFKEVAECSDKTKMVYEFDAADIDGSYMYPAMARSFRGEGFQWATQFAYDPLALAHSNSDYNTHFVNLVYTPQKALSLMIAGEVFRKVPRGKSYGTYPDSHTFEGFKVSYENNLSEMLTEQAFYYSNDTKTKVRHAATLTKIAGVGSSQVINYEGTGAYFLDKMDDSVWRLEVYPDVIALQDPHQNSSLSREVKRLYWRERSMTIKHPALNAGFAVAAINEGNDYKSVVKGRTLVVKPGVYLIANDAVSLGQRNDISRAFYVPREIKDAPTILVHEPPKIAFAHNEKRITATLAASQIAPMVTLFIKRREDRQFEKMEMHKVGPFEHQVVLDTSERWNKAGVLDYAIVVGHEGSQTTFPGGVSGNPATWDFIKTNDFYSINLLSKNAPLTLFDPARDDKELFSPHGGHFKLEIMPIKSQRLGLSVSRDGLKAGAYNPVFRTSMAPYKKILIETAKGYDALEIRFTRQDSDEHINIAIIDHNGYAWGQSVHVRKGSDHIIIPLAQLTYQPTILPSSYPTFLNDKFTVSAELQTKNPLNIKQLVLDGVQLSFDASAYSAQEIDREHSLVLKEILLVSGDK